MFYNSSIILSYLYKLKIIHLCGHSLILLVGGMLLNMLGIFILFNLKIKIVSINLINLYFVNF